MAKKLLIFTNHFFPEDFKVNDVAFELAKKNWEVTVVTGIPNYPAGHFFKGYGFFKKNREVLNSVSIIRLPLIPRGNASPIRLVLNYFSYTISIIFYSLYLAISKKYDKILVHHTSPIFVSIGALVIKKIRKTPIFFWNLDLWPESITAAGNVSNKLVLSALKKLVGGIYHNASRILISSKSFEKSIKCYNIPAGKIVYFPNWAEDVFLDPPFTTQILMTKEPGTFTIMFAGNVGEAQDFNAIVEAALLLKNEKIKWIIVGDGRKMDWLKSAISQHNLSDSFELAGRHPIRTMTSLFAYANAMLVSLKNEPIFTLTVPAKVQAYMAAGKPILAMLNGEGGEIVKDAGCGYACEAGDYNQLAENIIRLKNLPDAFLQEMGENGKRYYLAHFEKNQNINKLSILLDS